MPVSTTGRPAAVLSILVTANARPAQASLAQLDRQMAYSVKRQKAGAVAMQRAMVGVKFAAVGSVAAIAGAAFAASKYESAFASVRKTVQASEPTLKRINEGILEMSTNIPQSAASLAELAGEAGALGVHAKQLLGFTKTASMLGTTTTMTSEASATALAQLGNLMRRKTVKDFQRMGSTLVNLGNKGASTEDQISKMALGIAGAGRIVGTTTDQVLGIAAGLANIGIQPEMGGSAASRIMLGMDAAVTGGKKALPELRTWARTAGMTVEQFTQSFEQNVPRTISEFAKGLGMIKAEGGSISDVLNELGDAAHNSMNEIRVRKTLLGISANTRLFDKALRDANEGWKENTALTTEAEKRYETLASQLELLKGGITKFGIELGNNMLPKIKEVVEILQDPNLDANEKVTAVMHKIGDAIAEWAPMIAKLGAQFGATLASGFFRGFMEAGILAKMFMAAGFIRLIGGKGALLKTGTVVGGYIVAGMSKVFAASTAAQAGMAAFQGRPMLPPQAGGLFMSPAKVSPLGARAGKFLKATTFPAGLGMGASGGLATAARFAPLAAGAAGVANIALDVIGGDLEGAAFEAGGGIAGALIGGIFGPLGAMFGGGAGTIIGDWIGDQVQDTKIPLKTLAERIAEGGEAMVVAGKASEKAIKNLSRAHENVKDAREHEREQTKKVTRAERRYQGVLGKAGINSIPAIQAAGDLADEEMRLLRAKNKLKRAEELEGIARIGARISLSATMAKTERHFTDLRDERRAIRDLQDTYQRFGSTRKQRAELGERADKFDQDWAETLQIKGDTLKTAAEQISKKFAKHLRTAQLGVLESGPAARITKQSLIGPLEDTLPIFDETFGMFNSGMRDTKDKHGRALETMGGNVEDFASTHYEGMSNVTSNFQTAGKTFGADVANYALKAPFSGSAAGKQLGGGLSIPGTGAGDKVPITVGGVPIALTEPGERMFILNRSASRDMAMLEKMNASVPRRAAGGGLSSGAMQLAAVLSNRFGGSVSSGYRPGDDGFHGRGMAIDYVPADWRGASAYVNAVGPSLLEGIYNPGVFGGSPVSWDSGARVSSSFWGGEWGNHLDHIHAALSGGFTPVKTSIGKTVMIGPSGELLDVGNASFRKARKMANKSLRGMLPTIGHARKHRLHGGALDWGGWHGSGGSFAVDRPTLFGAGERGSEQVRITPKGGSGVHLHFHGQASAALATIDDVYAIVDGEMAEVTAHGNQMLRQKRKKRRA